MINNIIPLNNRLEEKIFFNNGEIYILEYAGKTIKYNSNSTLIYKINYNDENNNLVLIEDYKERCEIMEEIIKYRAEKKQTLEAIKIGAYIESYLKSNGHDTSNLFYHLVNENNKSANTTSLNYLIENSKIENKNFSSILITGFDHISTLIVDHTTKSKNLYLFDTSENCHQDQNAQKPYEEIVGKDNLQKTTCLNSTGQAIQKDECCTFWNTKFNTVIGTKTDISEILQNGKLKPEILETTKNEVCQLSKDFAEEKEYEKLLNISKLQNIKNIPSISCLLGIQTQQSDVKEEQYITSQNNNTYLQNTQNQTNKKQKSLDF